jgi:hypothetical protein
LEAVFGVLERSVLSVLEGKDGGKEESFEVIGKEV